MFFTEEQELIRNIAREFTQKEVAPRAKEIDSSDEFPYDLVKRCGELNFMGIPVPEEYGGAGADLVSQCLVIEEIAKECPTLALILDAHISLGCMPILFEGTEEQKQKYLVPLAKGEKVISFGLTEPSAGSDAGSSKSFAVLEGDEWVINGSKCFITSIDAAEVYIITAKTEVDGKKGVSAFIVEKGTPGFEIGKIEKKLGWHGSNTGELFFKNLRLPKDALLGRVNKGLPLFLRGLDEGRVAISAVAVGNAQGAFEKSVAYSKEREQFGKPICKFQAIAFYLADMATQIEAARNLLYTTAAMRDAGMPYSKQAAMCKLFCGETAIWVTDRAIQIHGGNGYIRDFGIERYWRDARGLTIGEGTSEIQKVVISGHILA